MIGRPSSAIADIRRWFDAGWPCALLLLFMAGFRTTTREVLGDGNAVVCDGVRPTDIATLEQCVALDPENAELMSDLADREHMAGDDLRAEALYRRALAVDPKDGDVHRRLAELLLARGDAERARAEAEAALAVQPNSPADADLIRRADDRVRGER